MSISGVTSSAYSYDYSFKNKAVDQSEQEERARQIASRMLSDLDADKNGSLSVSEIGVDESRLADADSDGDGKLSESELIGILSSMGPQTMMGGPRGGHGGPPPDVSEKFNQIDADNNGSITQEEFLASRPNEVTEEMASEMWSRLNSEGAESLTQKEFSEAMAAQGPPPGGGPRASGEESARNLADILLDSSDDEEDETELDMSTILSNIFTNYGQNQYKQRMDERLVAMMSASSGLNVTA